MSVFSACVYKIIPLYVSIFIGLVAGKLLEINRETIARIMLFILNPIVIFHGISSVKLDKGILFLPILIAGISSMMCLVFYKIASHIWSDGTKSLVGYSAGNGNTGYFGLPIALLLFNDQGEGIYIMSILGVTLFENTLGFYIFLRETMTPKDCLKNLLKLPSLYAFIFGFLYNIMGLPVTSLMEEYIVNIKGAYTIFGMMIIGLGLAGLKQFKIDFLFIGITFIARFLAWPLITLGIIFLDKRLIHFFDEAVYNPLILASIVPLGSNTVMMGSLMKIHPEKAATAVVLSILLALIYVPFMVEQFMSHSVCY